MSVTEFKIHVQWDSAPSYYHNVPVNGKQWEMEQTSLSDLYDLLKVEEEQTPWISKKLENAVTTFYVNIDSKKCRESLHPVLINARIHYFTHAQIMHFYAAVSLDESCIPRHFIIEKDDPRTKSAV